jgi:hypothetical protein
VKPDETDELTAFFQFHGPESPASILNEALAFKGYGFAFLFIEQGWKEFHDPFIQTHFGERLEIRMFPLP